MFFKKITRYPKFKCKGKSKDSFYISNDQFRLEGKRIRVPKLGWVKMREALRYEGKILSARISRTADQWHVSITVEIPEPTCKCESQAQVGVYLGINTYAFLSDNQYVLAPKPLRTLENKLAKLQRKLARKVKDMCDCGNNMDRDLNAAINLILITTGGLPRSYACGQSHL